MSVLPLRDERGRIPRDAYYTPPAVAQTLVDALPECMPEVILEPSVGGGAFARALGRRWPEAELYGCDVDSGAMGLGEVDRAVIGDFLTLKLRGQYDLIAGNPPYDAAELHVHRALDLVCPGGRVAFLLHLGFAAGKGRRQRLYPRPGATLETLHVLDRRPKFLGGASSAPRDYAWFVWRRLLPGEEPESPRLAWVTL